VRRRPEVGKDEAPLPPLATGIALGIWVVVMLTLALVVVPTIFGSCLGGTPAT
jgi:hypothetical protein